MSLPHDIEGKVSRRCVHAERLASDEAALGFRPSRLSLFGAATPALIHAYAVKVARRNLKDDCGVARAVSPRLCPFCRACQAHVTLLVANLSQILGTELCGGMCGARGFLCKGPLRIALQPVSNKTLSLDIDSAALLFPGQTEIENPGLSPSTLEAPGDRYSGQAVALDPPKQETLAVVTAVEDKALGLLSSGLDETLWDKRAETPGSGQGAPLLALRRFSGLLPREGELQ